MPTEAEALAGSAVYQLGTTVTDLIESYRDSTEAHAIIVAEADRLEDAYRRLGGFLSLIRMGRAA